MMSRTREVHRLKILATTVGAALLVCGLLLAYASSPAWAADITVTTTDDELNTDEDCSLREAEAAADTNAAVDGCAAGSASALDTIWFDVGRGQTIKLDSPGLFIQDDAGLTINGQKNITISSSDSSQAQLFVVDSGTVFNLKNLTVADAHSTLFGAGLSNRGGKVKVSNSTFSGNSAINNNGGAIQNSDDGTLKVSNSTFSENSAGNLGGGIINEGGGTLTVSNSTFSGNSAAGFSGGGAIANFSSGTVSVSNSTFSGNSANNPGGGDGGAIENIGSPLKVSNSTFSGNSATRFGGGIVNASSGTSSGTVTLSNSTFSGNSAAQSGGTLYVSTSTVTLKNTILANSTQGGECFIQRFGGTVNDRGYNLIEDGSCLTAASSRSGDPLLGALADNGGPTQTMALQAGSKAIDKGKSFGATTDQRGLPRPADFPLITNRGDGSDVGAYEVQP
jgi:CSLREA domain-containing protein